MRGDIAVSGPASACLESGGLDSDKLPGYVHHTIVNNTSYYSCFRPNGAKTDVHMETVEALGTKIVDSVLPNSAKTDVHIMETVGGHTIHQKIVETFLFFAISRFLFIYCTFDLS